MKKRYFLPFLQGVCFLLLSLFSQNCGSSDNLPLEGEQEPTEIIEQESNTLPPIMPELWQEVFSYLDCKGVLVARAVNSEWNKLITGFREAGIVGIKNNPLHIIDARNWVKRGVINFGNNKLKELTSATIPSFAFYHLMGHVRNLPQSLWPYLQGTQVHILSLVGNQIRDAGAIELAKALPATRMHTLNLGWNNIGDAGAIELAKALPATHIHTLYLDYNRIGDQGAIELAKALPRSQVHTLDLNYNQIGDVGAIELAKALPAMHIHTLYLGWNNIGASTQQLMKEQYPHIKWIF